MAIEITELKKRATMINDKVRMYLLPPLFNAAVRAGASIMNIYKNLDDYDISLKDDKTPISLGLVGSEMCIRDRPTVSHTKPSANIWAARASRS